MMGKTHISVGVAAAVCAVQPQSIPALLATTLGAALGSITPDVDISSHTHRRDAVLARAMVVALVVAGLMADHALGAQLWAYISEIELSQQAFGLLGFGALCAIGHSTAHRSFTHSLCGLVLFSVALGLIVPLATPGFVWGYASHLAVDLLNKKPLTILFPLPTSWSLGLARADGIANKALYFIGLAINAALLAYYVQKLI